MAEIATRWIQDGTAERTLVRWRAETRRRMDLALDRLACFGAKAPEGASHLWFSLPEPWTAAELVAAAHDQGVSLGTDAPFVVPGASRTRALRICTGSPRTLEELRKGLETLARILERGPGGDLAPAFL